MSYTVQNYPLLDPIQRIERHDQLPLRTVELLSCTDNSSGRDKCYTFVKQKDHLSLLVSYYSGPNYQYYCKQYDFPLAVLSWFPWALEEFRKPPAEGGLHAGAMISKDMDVEGEMLAVGSTTDGYCITNWSRNKRGTTSDYDPVEVSLSWSFLYERGFLAMWQKLGERYEQGLI